MTKLTLRILLVILVLGLNQASYAWVMTKEVRVFRVQGADAFTVANSPGSEAGIPYHGLQVYASLTEEGTLVDTDNDTCFRVGTNPVECIALAHDSTTTVLCEYCGSGSANIVNNLGQYQNWGPECKVLQPAGPGK